MNEYIVDDRMDLKKLYDEILAMSEEEKQEYIKQYEESKESNKSKSNRESR